MFNKSLVVLVVMMTTIFADEDYFNRDKVKPLIFSVMDSENEFDNSNANASTNFHITLFSGKVRNVYGLQLGLIANNVSNDFLGYDGTGIYSRIGGDFAGFQTVGIVGKVGGEFTGIQESGIYSYAGADFLGVQNGGLIGKIVGDLKGIQASGIISTASDVKGGQYAGIVNNADDVSGVQTAGIINNAGYVKGVQIGLINRSEKLDGIAIGLINVSDEGSVHLTGWSGGANDYQAGLKFAPNDYWYTILSVGDIQDPDEIGDSHTLSSYMGLQYPITNRFWIAGDIGSGIALPYNLDNIKDEEDIWGIFETRVQVGFKIFNKLSIYGGISQSYMAHGDDCDHDDFEEFEKTQPFFGIQF